MADRVLAEGARGRGSLGFWALTFLGLVVIGYGLSRNPGVTGTLVLVLLAFSIGLMAPTDLSFPALGFLVVFDSVFSLGTEVRGAVVTYGLGFSISNPLLVGIALRLVFEYGLTKRRLKWETIFLAGGLAGATVASSIFNLGTISRAAITYLGAAALLLVILSFGTDRLVRRLLQGIALGALIAGLSAVAAVITAQSGAALVGNAYHYIGHAKPLVTPRVSGLLLDPNALAFTLVVGLFAALAAIRSAWVKGLFAAGLLLALPVTYSRGGIVAALAGFLAYAAIRTARGRIRSHATPLELRWGIFYTGLLMTAASVFLAFTWAAQSPLFARFWNPHSVEVRVQLVHLAIQAFKANPVIGIGPGQFLALFGNYAHNTFLEAASELGVVGVSALLVLAWLGLKRSAGQALATTEVDEFRFLAWRMAGVVGVCLAALTLSLSGNKLMWAMLACGAIAGSGSKAADLPARSEAESDVSASGPQISPVLARRAP